MSFRARIAIGAAAAVALAVVLASVVVFFVVRGELRAQIDDTLEERAQEIFRIPLSEIPLRNGESFLGIRPGFGEPNTFVQVVKADGDTLRQLYDDVELPVSDEALALATCGLARRLGHLGDGGRRDARPGAVRRVRARVRRPDRPSVDRDGRDALSSSALPHRHRALGNRDRRRARARCLARCADAGPPAHRDRRARHGDRRSLRAHRGQRPRRAQPPGDELQLDARRSGGLESRPAPARRRRVARAANAAHEPPHEHRGARRRPRAAGGGARPASVGRRGAAR